AKQALHTFHAGRTIRAITFDVGGTLIEPWPSVGNIYAEVAGQSGSPGLSAALLDQRFSCAWRDLKDFRHTREQWAALVDATFGDLIEPPPSWTFFRKLYRRFAEPRAWRLFDDVVPALALLSRRDLKLGIISNWDERLRPLLRRLKLLAYFDTVVVSCEAGFTKPSLGIFKQAASNLALPLDTILH